MIRCFFFNAHKSKLQLLEENSVAKIHIMFLIYINLYLFFFFKNLRRELRIYNNSSSLLGKKNQLKQAYYCVSSKAFPKKLFLNCWSKNASSSCCPVANNANAFRVTRRPTWKEPKPLIISHGKLIYHACANVSTYLSP